MTPDEHTNHEFFLEVSDGHQLYVHDWGDPKAKTVMIFLHAGPGGGCSDKHKQVFDASQHRVIFFDQRGCGRSLPYGSLENNTTDKLIEDVETITRHLKLKEFVIVGSSWGATLALAYSVAYPRRVKALVLSGIFAGSHTEIDYFDKGEFRATFPEVWDRYVATVPKKYQDAPTKYHYKRALGKDERAARESACAYENLERAVLSLDDRFIPTNHKDPAYDPTSMLIEIHYMANYCFMPDRHIMDNARKLTMPVWMVQGRYDMLCPPITAYELHQKLPKSQLIWTIGGHRSGERETWNVIHSILLQFA